MTIIEQNWRTVLEQIRQAEISANRKKNSVRLLAVSKTFSVDDIGILYRQGQRDFGENYVQEWYQKAQLLQQDCPELQWHVIGQIQSNKSRIVAEHATWVHTIDRLKIARRLSEQRPLHLSPLQVCIEVNISADMQKHGIEPNQLIDLAREILLLPNICLRGLMCVASPDIHKAIQEFKQMQQLFLQLQSLDTNIDTLSMGMSADLIEAITHGATMVRIGSAIFGKRDYSDISQK